MNDYQKALENLGKHRAYINEQISELQEMVNNLDTDAFNFYGLSDLKELVERETPMKPKWAERGKKRCASCDLLWNMCGFRFYYCPNCGQRIYWSDEE